MKKIVHVAQRVESRLPPRRRRIEGFARFQVGASDKEMDMTAAAFISMPNRGKSDTVRRQPAARGAPEIINHFFNLLVSRLVIGGKSENGGGVPMLKIEGVGDLRNESGITPQHFYFLAFNAVVVELAEKVVGCATAGTGSMAKYLY